MGRIWAAIKSGDFDVARRQLVLQTTEEMTNLLKMFEPAVTQDATEESSGEQPERFSADAELPNAYAAPPQPKGEFAGCFAGEHFK
ncbi:MAG: hypothetical protein WKF30_07750 [Pyrinomonadaceae bacterium]